VPTQPTEQFDLDLIFGTFPTVSGPVWTGAGDSGEGLDMAYPVDPLFGFMDTAVFPSGAFPTSGPILEFDPLT
jgi:hypothetical protein